MKIATVQLVPVFGDIEGSIAKIERMISGIVPGAIDFLLLPELALAGPHPVFSTSSTTELTSRRIQFSLPPRHQALPRGSRSRSLLPLGPENRQTTEMYRLYRLPRKSASTDRSRSRCTENQAFGAGQTIQL